MLAGSFYPLNKGVAALCGGGILFKEKISDMACLSPNKKWGWPETFFSAENSLYFYRIQNPTGKDIRVMM
ncbi:MAG: hypothetical protein Q8O92_06670 [Candidatus Latescibacter sp.]|nr:hypothetical protein [Candidatus Latescibacter sp.]